MVTVAHILETARAYLPALAVVAVVATALKLLGVMAARRRLQAVFKRTMIPQALMVLTVALAKQKAAQHNVSAKSLMPP